MTRSSFAYQTRSHFILNLIFKNMNPNHRFVAMLAIIISCISYSCRHAQSKTPAGIEEARKAISESNAIYFKAFATGDSSIFINRYAEDCCIMAPGSPALCGPTAALSFFRIAYHNIGLRNGKFITKEVYGDGAQYVTEEGLWQSFDANGVLFDNGKFLVLWKKTPKGWKMFRDSFSSDRVGK
jgi:ketosteroid isomerase-like protein